jgi:hypothetical protein
MIHLHKWQIYYDFRQKGTFYCIDRKYRYCKVCNKWQREYNNRYGNYWENSYQPIGVERLIREDIVNDVIKDINMKLNAQKIKSDNNN